MARDARGGGALRRLRLALFVSAAVACLPRTALAVDPFEIQVYDGTADAPGQAGLETHLNHVANGVRTAEGPELPLHRQTHVTFEPSFGVTPFWELGGYLQTAVRSDGQYDYAGVKLRSKFVTPPSFFHHALRFGLNFELSNLPETYDRNVWGGEVRPIVAWETKHSLLAVNPILTRSAEWSFEPAAQALALLPGVAGAGLEYYGSTNGEQYLYEVVNLLTDETLELQVGVGEGLTSESNPLVFKAIVGIGFDLVPQKHANPNQGALAPWPMQPLATARASTTR